MPTATLAPPPSTATPTETIPEDSESLDVNPPSPNSDPPIPIPEGNNQNDLDDDEQGRDDHDLEKAPDDGGLPGSDLLPKKDESDLSTKGDDSPLSDLNELPLLDDASTNENESIEGISDVLPSEKSDNQSLFADEVVTSQLDEEGPSAVSVSPSAPTEVQNSVKRTEINDEKQLTASIDNNLEGSLSLSPEKEQRVKLVSAQISSQILATIVILLGALSLIAVIVIDGSLTPQANKPTRIHNTPHRRGSPSAFKIRAGPSSLDHTSRHSTRYNK